MALQDKIDVIISLPIKFGRHGNALAEKPRGEIYSTKWILSSSEYHTDSTSHCN